MWEVLFGNPSDYEHDDNYLEAERQHHVNIPNYFENIIPMYSLTDFKSHFRVEVHVYERLIQDLGPRLYHQQGPEKMSPEKQIAITMAIL